MLGIPRACRLQLGPAVDSEVGAMLARAQACAGPEDFRPLALASLRRWVAFDAALFLPAEPSSGPAVAIGLPSPLQQRLSRDLVRYVASDAVAREAARSAGGMTVDAVGAGAPIWAEVLAAQGIGIRLLALVDFGGRESGTIHLGGRRAELAPREIAAVAALRPVLGVLDAAFLARESRAPAPSFPDDGELAQFRARFATLTPREREIAALAGNGRLNREIAAALGTSSHTVHNQLKRVFEKLDVGRRSELALLMARAGCP